MRTEAPLYHHPVMRFWMLSRREHIETLARDPRFTSKRARQILGLLAALPEGQLEAERWERGFFFQDPPVHIRSRGYVSKLFSVPSVEAMRPMIASLVQRTLDPLRERGEMNVPVDLGDPIAMNVLTEMLDIPSADRAVFQRWTVDLLKPAGAGVESEVAGRKVLESSRSLFGYMRDLAEERWKNPGKDTISQAVAGVAQALVEDVSNQCTDVVIGGYVTTINQITNAVLTLLKHPAELEKLRRDRSLLPGAVDEILRYEPSVLSISRVATEDVVLEGTTIGKGDLVFGLTAAVNRDPDIFPDPDRCDITRVPNQHLSFGHGHHRCLGSPLIQVEVQEVLRALLDLPRWELGAGQYEYTHFHLQDRGPSSLHLRFDGAGG